MKKKRFPGKTPTLPRDVKAAAVKTEEYRDKLGEVSFWRDRSRFNFRKAEACVAWRLQQAWKTRMMHLGTNQEIFDAEL